MLALYYGRAYITPIDSSTPVQLPMGPGDRAEARKFLQQARLGKHKAPQAVAG